MMSTFKKRKNGSRSPITHGKQCIVPVAEIS